MEETWITSCTSTIQNFIEHSTRLHPNKLALTLQEQIDFIYQINLQLEIQVELEKQNQAGRVAAANNTLVFQDAAQFDEALKAEIDTVLSRQETLQETQALVLSQQYGEIRQNTIIYSHPRHLCLTQPCSHCGGQGHVKCDSCGGSGEKNCSTCSGSGRVLERKTVYDNFTKRHRIENHYHICYYCHGGKVDCSHCHGSGKLQCTSCQGTGLITQITKLHSVAIPDYQLIFFKEDVQQFIKDGLYKAGLANLEQYGMVVLENSEINNRENKVNFLFNAETPFARLTSPLPLPQNTIQQIQWIVYGTNPQILDAGHAVELMLKGDLDNLVYQATKNKLRNPFIARTSRKTICTFMESEAHQEMLDANCAGKSGDMLREELNRSVSTDYLNEALTSLKSIMSAVQKWSRLKWNLFASIMIYLLMPFYTAHNNDWFTYHSEGRLYLTPPIQLDTKQHIWEAVNIIINYCSLFIITLGIIIPTFGYIWRRIWVRYHLGKSLSRWSVHQRILRSRWFFNLIIVGLLTTILLLFFPIWTTLEDGMLFGKFPFSEYQSWILEFVKSHQN